MPASILARWRLHESIALALLGLSVSLCLTALSAIVIRAYRLWRLTSRDATAGLFGDHFGTLVARRRGT